METNTLYAYEKKIGIETRQGTDWPVYAVVNRIGPRKWMSAIICGGALRSVMCHSRKASAVETAKGLTIATRSLNMYGEPV